MIQNIIGSQLATENQNFETPSLVETRQGVSVLYKDHFLYSKYDPSKAILNIISNLSIPEYSIILIFSPVLWLGLKELLAKLDIYTVEDLISYYPKRYQVIKLSLFDTLPILKGQREKSN